MKYWQEGIYSWGHLITVLIVLIGVYFLLKLIIRIGLNIGLIGTAQERIVRFLRQSVVVFEPIALVILLGIFVLISPILHGTILSLLLLANINQIRNYFAGRMLQLNESIAIGTLIKSGHAKGTIISMDRFGLCIRTVEGEYFSSYQNLLSEGYLISNQDQLGGNYLISISDIRKESKTEMKNELYHLLRISPFIVPERKIRIDSAMDTNKATVSLAIRNKEHVSDLLAHLSDRGFEARIIND